MKPQIISYAIESCQKGHAEWFKIELAGIEGGDTSIRDDFYWTTDFSKSVQWSNREDAEKYLRDGAPIVGGRSVSNLTITEHLTIGDTLN